MKRDQKIHPYSKATSVTHSLYSKARKSHPVLKATLLFDILYTNGKEWRLKKSLSVEEQVLHILWISLSEYHHSMTKMSENEVEEACSMAASVFTKLFPKPRMPGEGLLAAYLLGETMVEWRRQ